MDKLCVFRHEKANGEPTAGRLQGIAFGGARNDK
jgi:hypothetical protein